MNTTIKKEHTELASKLAEELRIKWLNDELENAGATYAAVHDALYALSKAMEGQYTMDAWPNVVALFADVLDAVSGECGCIPCQMWRNVANEDGDVVEYEEAPTWAEADWAELTADCVNYRASMKLTRYETFAADVASMVEDCFVRDSWADRETELDGDTQWFLYHK
jgi:hypothetical protein